MSLLFPSTTQLLAAMRGQNTTNGWDVVVSCALDTLNSLLAKQYSAGQLASQIDVKTSGTSPGDHTAFQVEFSLALGAPVLQFAAGVNGSCTLTIPIASGSYTVDDSPPTALPQSAYQIVCQVPIVAIRGDGTVAQAGDVVTFAPTGGAAGDCNVVLHFQNTDDTAYKVVPTGTGSSSTDGMITQYLPAALPAWFQANVSELQYVLASVTSASTFQGLALVPARMVFATAGDGAQAVLSLYIETTSSPHPGAGNPHPQFQPGDVAMLPVPGTSSASVIFSHDLIAQSYLAKMLAGTGVNLVSVPVDSGFAFQYAINKSMFGNPSSNSMWSNFSVDNIDVNLANNPLTLMIADGAFTVVWEYHTTLNWSSSAFYSTSDSYGEIYFDVSLQKTAPLTLTGHSLGGQIAIGRNDYTLGTSVDHYTGWEVAFEGACNDMPAQLDTRNLVINFPAVSIDLGALGFFAVTNLMFPGQAQIALDAAIGVHTPHDLVLFGTLGAPAPHTSVLAGQRARFRVDPAAGAPGASALVNAVMTQDQTAADFYNTVANGDGPALATWLNQNGFTVTADDIAKASLQSAAAETPDIRLWTGVYDFSAPASLDGKRMVIAPKTGRVTLADNLLTLTSTTADTITWSDGPRACSVTFTDHVDDTGASEPTTLTGTITTPGAGSGDPPTVEPIAGVQFIEADSAGEGWHTDDGVEQAALIIGTISSLLGIFQFGSELLKAHKEKQAADQIARSRDVLEGVEMNVIGAQQPDATTWRSVETGWTTAAEQATNQAIRNLGDLTNRSAAEIVQALPAGLRDTLAGQFRDRVWATAKPALERSLGAMRFFFDVDGARPKIDQNLSAPKLDALLQAGGYLAQVQLQTASGARKEALLASAQAHRDAIARLATERTSKNADLAGAQTALDAVNAQLADPKVQGNDRDAALQRQADLDEQVDDLTDELTRNSDASRQETADATRDSNNARDAEAAENAARQAADAAGRDVFGR